MKENLDFWLPSFRHIIIAMLLIFVIISIIGYLWDNHRKIKGFDGIPWGSTIEDIKQKHKATSSENISIKSYRQFFPSGKKVIIKNTKRWDEPLTVIYIIHPILGLVRGSYRVPFGSGFDCKVQFRKFERIINDKFMDLRKRHGKKVFAQEPICTAIRIAGKVVMFSEWVDPAGPRIAMFMGKGPTRDKIVIVYETENYYSWKKTRESYFFSFLHLLQSLPKLTFNSK